MFHPTAAPNAPARHSTSAGAAASQEGPDPAACCIASADSRAGGSTAGDVSGTHASPVPSQGTREASAIEHSAEDVSEGADIQVQEVASPPTGGNRREEQPEVHDDIDDVITTPTSALRIADVFGAHTYDEAIVQTAREAFLGFTFTSLSGDGPVQLNFNSGRNGRVVEESRIHDLVRSFRALGVNNWVDPVPIIVRPEYGNLDTVTRERVDNSEGPILEWLPAAHGQWIECLGGRHRREALRLHMQEIELGQNGEQVRRLDTVHDGIDEIDALAPDQMVWLVKLYNKDIIGANQAVKSFLSATAETTRFH